MSITREATIPMALLMTACFTGSGPETPQANDTTATETGDEDSTEPDGGTESGAETSPAAAPDMGSSSETSEDAEPDPDTETSEGTQPEPDCPIGELDCPCTSGEACNPGLVCEEGLCVEPVCGNGELEAEEQCDDNNLVDGDGCDSDCSSSALASVDCGVDSCCALLDTGVVRCWGHNDVGQLGRGDDVPEVPSASDSIPVDFGDERVTRLVSSHTGYHHCALLDSGALSCWGSNPLGELGLGHTEHVGLDETPGEAGALEFADPILDFDLGRRHTCVLFDTHELSCWGSNGLGMLGLGDTEDVHEADSEPRLVFNNAPVMISTGMRHSCVLLETGEVSCWGYGFNGALGQGDAGTIGDNELATEVPALLDSVVDVDAGWDHTCALRDDGVMTCWGHNAFGQLGYGDTEDRFLATWDEPVDPGIGPIVDIDTTRQTCALNQQHQLICWGHNEFGALGQGHTHEIGDTEPAGLGGVIVLDGGVVKLAKGTDHNCALLDTGALRCWGSNVWGQLGRGDHEHIGDNELPISVSPIAMFE